LDPGKVLAAALYHRDILLLEAISSQKVCATSICCGDLRDGQLSAIVIGYASLCVQYKNMLPFYRVGGGVGCKSYS